MMMKMERGRVNRREMEEMKKNASAVWPFDRV
jgi:hypothetical protein